jgi:hypothetical protein
MTTTSADRRRLHCMSIAGRRYSAVISSLFVLAFTGGCDSDQIATPPETQYDFVSSSEMQNPRDAIQETGTLIQLLEAFNNEVVACYERGEIEHETATQLTLLTSVMRFTATPATKLGSLLQTLSTHIEHGRTSGKIAEACGKNLAERVKQLSTVSLAASTTGKK